jgi:pyrroline-5-carboxylate reductase
VECCDYILFTVSIISIVYIAAENNMNTSIGIIGLGSMGGMIAERLLIDNKSFASIYVSTRSSEKTVQLKSKYPHVFDCSSNRECAEKANIILVCVKGSEIPAIYAEIVPSIASHKHIVSINANVALDTMSGIFPCKVSKLIPTVLGEVGLGVHLASFGDRVSENDRKMFFEILKPIGRIYELAEKDMGIAVEMTSCMPGLLSTIFNELKKAAVQHGTLDEKIIEMFLLETIYATARFYRDKNMSFDDTVKRVATKGGLTETGSQVLKNNLPNVYDEMFDQIMQRRDTTVAKLNDELQKLPRYKSKKD